MSNRAGSAPQAYETLVVETTNQVATITINRPEVHNAVNPQVRADLRRALDVLSEDDQVGAVLFTGAGDRAFVAGTDIQQLRDYTFLTALESKLQRLYDDIENFGKPTIAAVNGFALGGGCELALACDIRIASDTARFGLPETKLSIIPGAGGTQRLARLVGAGAAIDMIMTGRVVDAREALTMGLVTRVVPAGALLAAANGVAQAILANGPLAVQLAKLVIRTGLEGAQRTGLVAERLAQAVLYASNDKQEGVDAFLAKRPAVFRGE